MDDEPHSHPDWRRAYRRVRRLIDDGVLGPGDRLPTIAALASDAGVTRHSARRALERLRDEGRSSSWQGSGHRVSEPTVEIRFDAFPRWGANTARKGRKGSARMIGARTIRADRALARDLRVKPGARLHRAELLRFADDRPMALSRSHFSAERLPGIVEELRETLSVTKALARLGIENCSRVRTRLEARMPNAHEALMISLPRAQPVLVSTGVNQDEDGAVVEVAVTVFRADCIAFEF
ncbi:MAG: GntR family transcriptional regulator [Pseudomonadota bacterium]